MSVRIPKYRHHKPSGQALVAIHGRRVYLGKYGSAESKEKYRRLIAEFVADDHRATSANDNKEAKLSINELILAYFRFAKSYYVKNGQTTDEIAGLRAILRRLKDLFGHTMAAEFGPKSFKLLREQLIQEKLSRKYINDSMARVRRMFRWAVAEEHVPPAVYQALTAVGGLRRGRSGARETGPIESIADSVIEATLVHLPEVVADMVRLQRLTAMRPKEVCIVRPCDIEHKGEIWLYRPATHKTEHAGKQRVIPLGPRAQEILLRYLVRGSEEYCFQPRDSEARRLANRHDERITPISLGNKPGTNRVKQPQRQAGNCYTTASYRRAIHRACDKAFLPEVSLDSEQLTKWRSEHRWSPNQLRHSAATQIRSEFGLEAAQVILGHSGADVTQIYAERDMAKAETVALRIG